MVHQVKYQTHPTNPRKDEVRLGHSVGNDNIPRKIPGQYATAPCGLHPQLWHLEGWRAKQPEKGSRYAGSRQRLAVRRLSTAKTS